MRIAIIEDNPNYQNVIKIRIEEHNKNTKHEKFDVEYFLDSHDFGKAALDQYKIIISNVNLPNLKGTKLIDSIKSKTDADLALMSSKNGWLSKEIVDDKRIATIIDKNKPDQIVEWLKYMQSRTLINDVQEEVRTAIDECSNEISNIKE